MPMLDDQALQGSQRNGCRARSRTCPRRCSRRINKRRGRLPPKSGLRQKPAPSWPCAVTASTPANRNVRCYASATARHRMQRRSNRFDRPAPMARRTALQRQVIIGSRRKRSASRAVNAEERARVRLHAGVQLPRKTSVCLFSSTRCAAASDGCVCERENPKARFTRSAPGRSGRTDWPDAPGRCCPGYRPSRTGAPCAC